MLFFTAVIICYSGSRAQISINGLAKVFQHHYLVFKESLMPMAVTSPFGF